MPAQPLLCTPAPMDEILAMIDQQLDRPITARPAVASSPHQLLAQAE